MIYGIGTDIIEVERIAKHVSGQTRFKGKIFSSREIEYCESFKKGKAQHYAARYAAKEAFFKAIGTGWRGGIAFREISIINDELGKPVMMLSGKAKTFAGEHGFTAIHVSLSHLEKYACAVVVVETN